VAAEKSSSSTPSSGAADEFVITRIFSAPRSLVFSAWTEPRHLAAWWGPRPFTAPICELDLRLGGAYHIVMRSPEGEDYPIRGVYQEIVAPERIVMTMDCTEHPADWHDMVKPNRGPQETNPAGIMLTTVTFEELDDKTRLTVRIRFDSTAIRDAFLKMGMTEGWSLSLDRLEELLPNIEKVGSGDAREIAATRLIDAPRELVFAAWTDPKHVAKWWGPTGFTNTFQEFDLRPGGVWKFVMHGPDGTDYPNTNRFVEVVEPERIVFDHLVWPKFRAEITLTEQGGKTLLAWRMRFESAADYDKIKPVAVPGLEQNLDRLAAHVAETGTQAS
jgi:uncharacterized protein YndB with AHSA1/START domain